MHVCFCTLARGGCVRFSFQRRRRLAKPLFQQVHSAGPSVVSLWSGVCASFLFDQRCLFLLSPSFSLSLYLSFSFPRSSLSSLSLSPARTLHGEQAACEGAPEEEFAGALSRWKLSWGMTDNNGRLYLLARRRRDDYAALYLAHTRLVRVVIEPRLSLAR